MQIKKVFLTKEGYNMIKDELEYLITYKRAKISDKIADSFRYGKLYDNNEYEDAKNEQFKNEERISELQNKLLNAVIISKAKIDNDIVNLGNTVTILDKEFNEKLNYTIVGTEEADLKKNKISNESPLGRALLGAKIGQIIESLTPEGVLQYEVLSNMFDFYQTCCIIGVFNV